MKTKTGIRPYGPGKFDTILDSYVYGVTLNGGTDAEFSSASGSWFGLLRHGRTIFQDHDPFLETLNDEERDKLTSAAGVIVREDSDGFVGVSYYHNEPALDAAWQQLEDEYLEEEEE